MKKTSAHWTEPEIRVILDHFERRGPQYCAETLQALGYERNRISVGQKGRKIGLKYKGPKLGSFRKGHQPANKGQKMPAHVYERARNTMFKKGCRRGAANNNYVLIGQETFRVDGYWWVKIAEKKWALKHRMLWEKHNGPIPKGHCVVFRDGNPHNVVPGNLELITRKEAVYRNRWGDGPKEYSLIAGRAARSRLKKHGIGRKAIRENPELLEVSKAETLLKLKSRKQHGIKA